MTRRIDQPQGFGGALQLLSGFVEGQTAAFNLGRQFGAQAVKSFFRRVRLWAVGIGGDQAHVLQGGQPAFFGFFAGQLSGLHHSVQLAAQLFQAFPCRVRLWADELGVDQR